MVGPVANVQLLHIEIDEELMFFDGDDMKIATMLAYAVMVMAMCATFYFTLALKPSSLDALLFLAAWLAAILAPLAWWLSRHAHR